MLFQKTKNDEDAYDSEFKISLVFVSNHVRVQQDLTNLAYKVNYENLAWLVTNIEKLNKMYDPLYCKFKLFEDFAYLELKYLNDNYIISTIEIRINELTGILLNNNLI